MTTSPWNIHHQEMNADYEKLTSQEKQRLRRKLKNWYTQSARALPWRETHDPYRIWISEIMLQQTTVAAVGPYYRRFFETFPNLESLAKADEQAVLKLWEGLGYYSRARNIWKAARQLWEESHGTFPETVAELEQLPGIGRYTAGAIVSFAFNRPAPIVEANTLRLYCRLMGYADNPRSTAGQRALWQFAEDILPRTDAGLFNQALMELGSQCCTPKDPNCPECPLQQECRAFRDGKQASIPRPPEKILLTDVSEASIAVRKGDAYLLRQRPEGERWAGLWDFPRFELEANAVQLTNGKLKKTGRLLVPELSSEASKKLQQQVCQLTGIEAELGAVLTEIKHGVTRFRIHLFCIRAEYKCGRLHSGQALCWAKPPEFSDFAFSTTGRKFADLLGGTD